MSARVTGGRHTLGGMGGVPVGEDGILWRRRGKPEDGLLPLSAPGREEAALGSALIGQWVA